jgi:hypothetical protein
MVKLSYTTKETQACASKNMKNRISQKKCCVVEKCLEEMH